jgi:hypothetical protein
MIGDSMENNIPTRDTTGYCEGECRNRVQDREKERQESIAPEAHCEPSPESPSWTKERREQPAV